MSPPKGRTPVLFLHASPAALGPLSAFYKTAAPELAITHLLDDGLLALLAGDDPGAVERRLENLTAGARSAYGVRAVLLTCSALTGGVAAALGARAGLPVVRIDDGLARQAVARGGHVGVLVTFAPTLGPTRALLERAAAHAGTQPRLDFHLVDGAYGALLAGDTTAHDDAVASAARALVEAGVDRLVLAQISLARVLPRLQPLGVPTSCGLQTSLEDLRAAIGAGGAL
jgi:hypothetical protein